jgi:hypothetical protein
MVKKRFIDILKEKDETIKRKDEELQSLIIENENILFKTKKKDDFSFSSIPSFFTSIFSSHSSKSLPEPPPILFPSPPSVSLSPLEDNDKGFF